MPVERTEKRDNTNATSTIVLKHRNQIVIDYGPEYAKRIKWFDHHSEFGRFGEPIMKRIPRLPRVGFGSNAGGRLKPVITRIEISGFRNLVNFTVDLNPLQIIAGPNAAGKSNFFDALSLLSALATNDSLRQAFGWVRGEALDQFTTSKPNARVREMKFGVEAIVPTRISDPWGEEAELKTTHLRYEIVIGLCETSQSQDVMRIIYETLRPLSKEESLARLPRGYRSFAGRFLRWKSRAKGFISAEGETIVLHQDGRSGRKRQYHSQALQGTVLSAVSTATFGHAFAMRQVLSSIRCLQLEPDSLREPSRMGVFEAEVSEHLGQHGDHLPGVLAWLKSHDPRALAFIAKDLKSVVSDVKAVGVREDRTEKRWVAEVEFSHGGPYPASLLSDGTLRILALTAMKFDPRHSGTLCFEEPENGIHPQKMRGLLQILRGLTTSLREPGEGSSRRKLRQLLVNTHSPALVSIADMDTLLFAETVRQYNSEIEDELLVGRFLPVRDELGLRSKGERRSYITRHEIVEYLATVDSDPWKNSEEQG